MILYQTVIGHLYQMKTVYFIIKIMVDLISIYYHHLYHRLHLKNQFYEIHLNSVLFIINSILYLNQTHPILIFYIFSLLHHYFFLKYHLKILIKSYNYILPYTDLFDFFFFKFICISSSS